METKTAAVGVAAMVLLIAVVGAVGYGIGQSGQVDMNESETTSEASNVVNESEVNKYVRDSTDGAADLKRAFQSEYQYDNSVKIKQDGQVMLTYSSAAQNGNQLKEEMKNVALLYADASSENPNVGALTIQANGAVLTVPADSAIAHGDGRINEEAYFKTVRWDSMNSANSSQP